MKHIETIPQAALASNERIFCFNEAGIKRQLSYSLVK